MGTSGGTTSGGGGTVSDATGSTKGVVQLAGDLAGTAAAPTVPGKVPVYATVSRSANFTAAVAAVHLVDTTGGTITATLPAANVAGQQVVLKLAAGTNPVTVVPAGSDTIGAAATTASMTLPSEIWEFESSGVGQWHLIGGNKSLSSLDARFLQLAGGQTVSGAVTFSTEPVVPSLKVTGTTGAPQQGRFVGVTVSGAPTSGTYQVGDYIVTQNGQMFACTAAGTPGTWAYPRDGSDLLTTGEETIPRLGAFAGANLSNQRLQLTHFTARKSETTTQVRFQNGGTGTTTPTLVRVGLYSIASNGDGTLVASTTNDTTLMSSAAVWYTKSWSSSYAKVAGQRYAVGVLIAAATAGSIQAISPSQFSTELVMAPRLCGFLVSQSDLPSTFTDAALSAASYRFYAAILP